jgi:hypothetical protein
MSGFGALTPQMNQAAGVESFKPTIDAISSPRNIARVTVIVSPYRMSEAIAVPAAPIPTHTAYAVPTGRDFTARDSSNMLALSVERKKAVGHRRVNPAVALRLVAQHTSRSPAIIRIIQGFMERWVVMLRALGSSGGSAQSGDA